MFPIMGAALAEGLVGVDHVRVLADAHRKYPRLRPVLTDTEAHIVDLATHADPGRFSRELLALCHRVDPDAVDAAQRDRQSDYHLRVSTTLHGAVRVDGLLPPEDPFNPHAPGEPDVYLALSHRNVHALQRILTTAISTHDDTGSHVLPQVNSARPVLSVTVPLDSLLEDSQHNAMGTLERFGVPHAALTAASAQRLACDGVISPLIINRDGQIIATPPTVRAVPAHIRKAVISRDTHCRFPHCRQRIDEVHHIIYASHGGHTTMTNLAGLCYYHHRHIAGNANQGLQFTNQHNNKHWISHPLPQRE